MSVDVAKLLTSQSELEEQMQELLRLRRALCMLNAKLDRQVDARFAAVTTALVPARSSVRAPQLAESSAARTAREIAWRVRMGRRASARRAEF